MKNIIIVIVVGLVVWFGFMKKSVEAPVATSEEITEKITYNNTDKEHIVVDLPLPGAAPEKNLRS